KALLQYWPKDKIDQWNKDWTLSQKIRQIYLIQFKPIYLIFDQFEELFTLGKEDEASTFFETLRALLSSQEQTKVLLSMREDYLAFLSDYEHIIPTLFDNRMRLEKMSKKNLTEVVISTAEYYNIQLEPEESAAEAIIEKLKDERGEVELANLQIFLDQLYRADAALRQKERNTERNIRFTLKAIQETKELEDVIGNFLDTQINKLEIDLRKKGNQVPNTPMTVLFTLVTNDGTKRSKQLEEVKTILEEKGITADIVDHCVKQFKEWRIIR
ncbi:MAG: ATP-binding protein, partial [Bacteroidota bacterium]